MPRLFPAVQRTAIAGLSAATLVLAACSDPASSPDRAISPEAASATQSPELNDPNGHGHVFHTKQWFENEARNDAGHGKPGGNTGISYHGGPVLRTATNVAAVYWASAPIFTGGPTVGTHGAGTGDGSLVGYFLSNLGGSSYFKINTTYTDANGAAIANVVNYTQFTANGTNAPVSGQSVSDAEMLSMLQNAFATNQLTYDPSTLYAIFTGPGVNLGGGFGTQYCAYHYHGNVIVGGVSKTVLYAAMPYNYTYPGVCTNGTAAPNGDPGADAEVNTLAHEVEETTTDLMGNAWYDVRGYENADKCAWTWGGTLSNGTGVYNITVGTKNFLIQQNWVNSGSGGCSKGI